MSSPTVSRVRDAPDPYVVPAPRGPLLARVRASVRARRLVPTALALLVTDGVQRLQFRISAGKRAEGLAIADAIVGGTPAEADRVAVARDNLAARARAWELHFRPWAMRALPIDGADRLRAAQATGRGLVIGYNHTYPVLGWPVALAPHLRDALYVHGDWVLGDYEPGTFAYQVGLVRTTLGDTGMKLCPATGSRPKIVATLQAGGAVFNGFDAPGSTETPFLGKTVELATGSARLAKETGALFAAVHNVPRGRSWELLIAEIVDPEDFDSVEALQHHLVTLHETLILRAPHNLEGPRDRGWPVSDRTAWRRK